MFSSAPKRPLATIAVVAGCSQPRRPRVPAPPSATPGDPPARTSNVTCQFPDVCKTVVFYNGHADLVLNGPDVTVISN